MSTKEKDKVQFIQFHQPALESGDYHLKVEQTIEDTKGRIPAGQTYSRELTFTVQGQRFDPLTPEDIYAVFPPAESLGEHSNVLPHITVKRSTLPWERYPGISDNNLTWLSLLVFRDSDFEDESDKPKPKNITLGELLQGESNIFFPTDMELQLGQRPKDLVTVFDIKKKYIQDILPNHDDLAYLAHVRKAIASDQPIIDQLEAAAQREFEILSLLNEYATIIANRLPEPNGLSIVHLVSLEGRYQPDTNGDLDGPHHFDFRGAGDEDLIRFVSLASWNFSCIDPRQSFTQLLQRLNITPSTPRLPSSSNPQADQYLDNGYITVPHKLRKGSQTISWYRGPLNTGFNTETHELPVKAADELMRYDSEISMFDLSYSAAWQLGRMLMLQNQNLAIELYNWKREHAQHLKKLGQVVSNLPLITRRQNRLINVIPPNLKEWFHGIELLQGIPFNYLVPDRRLLPPESIRFFCVDAFWLDCLQDGAFSIGRVTSADIADDRKMLENVSLKSSDDRKITGFIMRSRVVSGWPGLLVDGYDQAVEDLDSIDPTEGEILPLLRMETLSRNILICLFQGEVKTVDVHLKPESMHFGLDAPTQASPEWSKNLRTENGEPTETLITPIPWRHEEKGVINFEDLSQQMNQHLQLDEFTSGQFGLQMIEGVQKVRFVWSD